MAVSAIPVGTRLTLRLNVGMDENLNPIYRSRSWSNVKPSASHAHLYTLAQEISSLQAHTLLAIRRSDETELEED